MELYLHPQYVFMARDVIKQMKALLFHLRYMLFGVTNSSLVPSFRGFPPQTFVCILKLLQD